MEPLEYLELHSSWEHDSSVDAEGRPASAGSAIWIFSESQWDCERVNLKL